MNVDLAVCKFNTYLTTNPLRQCLLSGRVDFSLYVSECQTDLCANPAVTASNAQKLACDRAEMIVLECYLAGLPVLGWREYFGCGGCQLHAPFI